MATRIMNSAEDLKKYDEWIKNHPHGNLWQSLEWKTYQEKLGREVRIYVVEDSSQPSPSSFAKATEDKYPSPLKGRGDIVASALVVVDRTTFGLSTWDIPRGPLCENHPTFAQPSSRLWPASKATAGKQSPMLEKILEDAKTDKCMSLYLSPPTELNPPTFAKATAGKENLKLKTSSRQEQPEATRMIDLTQCDDDILRHMKPKGRYNIGVAEKHGMEVRESRDSDAFYKLLKATSQRDGFKTLPKTHYKAFLEHLPGSFLLLAYISQPPLPDPPPQPSPRLRPTGEGEGTRAKKVIAGLMGVVWGRQGIYYYGASDYVYRACMAPYLLQWEAMRYCKTRGCRTYDLLGIVKSEPLSLTLPPRGREKRHPWVGVSKFKEQFGGRVIAYSPEQELVLKPLIKNLLAFKRRFF